MCKGGSGPISWCQVLNCREELRGSVYSSKRRVCSLHRQALAVQLRSPPDGDAVDSLYRFCQQHGRLELLSGFDGARKSCRESARTRSNRRCRALTTSGEPVGVTGTSRAARGRRPEAPAAARVASDADTTDFEDIDADNNASWMEALFNEQQGQQQWAPASPDSLQDWLCGAATTSCTSSGDGDGDSQLSHSAAAVSSVKDNDGAKPMAMDGPASDDASAAAATSDCIASLLQDEGFWSFAAAHSDLDSLCAAAGPDGGAADGAGQQQQQQSLVMMASDEPALPLQQQQQAPAAAVAPAAASESCGAQELLTALSGSGPCSPGAALLVLPSLSGHDATCGRVSVLQFQPHVHSSATSIQQLAAPSPASGLCQAAAPAAANAGLPSPAGLAQDLPTAAQAAAAGAIAALGSEPVQDDDPAMLQCLLEQELLTAAAPTPRPAQAQALRQQQREQERARLRAQVHRRLRKHRQWLASQKLAKLLLQQPDLLAALAPAAAATSG